MTLSQMTIVGLIITVISLASALLLGHCEANRIHLITGADDCTEMLDTWWLLTCLRSALRK